MQGSGEDAGAAEASGRRCPDCGALVSADARWCGQCFRSLTEPEPEPEPGPGATTAAQPPTAPAPRPATRAPTWPCPSCGNENPIEVDACVVCGTSFAALMRQDEALPRIEPRDAVTRSLIFPGLGHRKAGRATDGLARGVLFALVLVMLVLTGSTGLSSPVGVGIFLLYLVAAIVVYVGSAYEAAHIAEGGQPFISARMLLWLTAGLILGSVGLLALAVVFGSRS